MTLRFPHHAIDPTVSELSELVSILRELRLNRNWFPPEHPALVCEACPEPDEPYLVVIGNRRGQRLTHNQRLDYANSIWRSMNEAERVVYYFELTGRFWYKTRRLWHDDAFRTFVHDTMRQVGPGDAYQRLREASRQLDFDRLAYVRSCYAMLLDTLRQFPGQLPASTLDKYTQMHAQYCEWVTERSGGAASPAPAELPAEPVFRHLDLKQD